jgi:hypothetical protein
VQATTTSLPADLQHRLETAGLTPASATQVVALLPPAGQYELATELQTNPYAVQQLSCTYRDALAVRLRITTADADLVSDLLRAVPS